MIAAVAARMAISGNVVRVWIADIIRVPPEQRTERDWGRLGTHHAQAMLARVTHYIPREKREIYLLSLIAAARHENRRLSGRKICRYYRAMYDTLDLSLAVEESERGWLGPRLAS